MRCKKLKRDGERKKEKGGGGTTTGRHGIQLPLEKGIPDTMPWLSFLFAKLLGVAYVSYVSSHVSVSCTCVVASVYSGSTNDRPVYRHVVVGRKSFGDRGPRKWTERTGTCCRGSRVSSSRLTGKRPPRRHIKPRALHTLVQYFAGRRLRFPQRL